MRPVVLAVALVALAGLVAVVLPGDAVQRGAIPVFAPVPVRGGSTGCLAAADGLPHVVGKQQPWVDPDPIGATVLWSPGLNARDCHAVISHIDQLHARQFAAAVRAAKPYPPGDYNCPMDDDRSATAFLSYVGRVDAEVIQLHLSGCESVTAPHRSVLEAAGIDQLGTDPLLDRN